MRKSNFLRLNIKDLARGILVSALAGGINVISDTLAAGSLKFNAADISHTALITGVAYLAKNFFTNSKDIFAKKEAQ
jgi:hypothetical protein